MKRVENKKKRKKAIIKKLILLNNNRLYITHKVLKFFVIQKNNQDNIKYEKKNV